MIIPIKVNTQEELDDILSCYKDRADAFTQEFPFVIDVDKENRSVISSKGFNEGEDYIEWGEDAKRMVDGDLVARFNSGKRRWGLLYLPAFRPMIDSLSTPTVRSTRSDIFDALADFQEDEECEESLGDLMKVLHDYAVRTRAYDCDIRPVSGYSWDNASIEVLEDVIEVLEAGAKKYDDNNWKSKANMGSLHDSLGRHIKKLRFSEIDDDTKLFHYAHALCNCMFIMYHLQ